MTSVRGLVGVVSLLGVVVAVAAAVAAAPAAGGAGAERLPATCIAELGASGAVYVYVLTDEFPKYWPIEPLGATATAHGDATFTPSARVNVNCVFDGSTNPGVFASAPWPQGTFTASSSCGTGRGGDDYGHGAAMYSGSATVTTVKQSAAVFGPAQVKISCHMDYTGIWP